MTPENGPVSSVANAMTHEDLREMLRRALRMVVLLGVLLFLVFTFALGWRSGLLELAGALISYTGIREWRSLTHGDFLEAGQRPNGATHGSHFGYVFPPPRHGRGGPLC